MDRLDSCQADMDSAIDRCASFLQDARDCERLVVMLAEALGTESMRDHNRIALFVAKCMGDIRAQHCAEHIYEGFALGKRKRIPVAITVVFEVIGRCAQHPISTVRIAERH